jgi:DNA-binding LacI/PurR family transcriptional regulator
MGCKAIVLYPVPRTPEQFRKDYLKTEFKDFPIILLDNAFPEQGRSQVVFDNYRAGYNMTELLLKEGHKRIAFMMPDSELLVRSIRDRYKGFRDALQEAGIPFADEDLWVVNASRSIYSTPKDDVLKNIKPKLANLLSGDHPTAVIAVEDTTAVYTISIAKEQGIDIPGQLRVVGFDNLGIARLFEPTFPTTAPDFTQSGAIAVEMAIDQALGNETSGKSVFIHTLSVPVKRR